MAEVESFNPSARGRQGLIIGVIIALVGLGLSIYSLKHHIEVKASGQTDAACNIGGKFNCDDVALSPYSEIAGVPLSILGLAYFAAMLILSGLGLRGGKVAREHLHAYVAMTLIGVATSAVLGTISILNIGSLCLICIGVYILTVLQAGTVFAYRKEFPSGFGMKSVGSGGATAAIVVAVVIALWTAMKPAATVGTATDGAKKDTPKLTAAAEEIPITRSAYAGLGEDYRKGSDSAKVVLVEFADFQCPACASMYGTLEALAKDYGDRIQVVFRNYPLDSSCNPAIRNQIHPQACKAAVMARCAGQYGKFWNYTQLAFDNQASMSDAKLKDWARQVGLTDDQINVCWDNKDLLDKVKEDIALGDKVGVDSTPTLFINGRKVLGDRSLPGLRQQVDALLQ
jgi:protein-disulfide isomerase